MEQMIAATVLSIIISISLIVYGYFKFSFKYWESRGIPSDKPTFPYGHFKDVGKKVAVCTFLKEMYDKYKPSGVKFCGLYVSSQPIALLLDLKLIKKVLVKENERGIYYNEQDDPLTANLVKLDGEKWKKLRYKLTPTFSSGKMRFMFSTVVEIGERLCAHISECVEQSDDFEIRELMARFTGDVIGACAFGIECNSLKDANAEFLHYGRKAIHTTHSVLLWTILSRFKTFARKLRIKSIPTDVSTFFMRVVSDTVKFREQNHINRNDFMDILIKMKNDKDSEKSITFNEIAAQSYIFWIGGFETTSTTLTFCLYELALNVEIQTKARNAIQEAYKKYSGQLTYEMMMDLTYINQILEETLRKYPIFFGITRQTKNDYTVPGTTTVIESGITSLIPVFAIHHDPDIYPNPDNFDPLRFTNDEKKKRDPMAWLPFGEGPRICIGLRFGMMQMKIALITLLNRFEFSIGSKTTVPITLNKMLYLLAPEGDVYLNIKPVHKITCDHT